MAYTVKGAAERKTRLIRSGTFDWRRAIFEPYPQDEFEALSDTEKTGPSGRFSDSRMLNHYNPICDAQRIANGKDPYDNFERSYGLWTTFEMSDHLPIWIELEVDYSDEYLERYV